MIRGLPREPPLRLPLPNPVDRVAAFVDAGYLLAAGSEALVGQARKRSELILDCCAAIETVAAKVKDLSGLPLLRVYWYDGTDSGPTIQQRALAECADVKLRLGFVRKDEQNRSQQKGVDSLLVTDMITLARNRAVATCVLVSGDADLLVGVQQAQEHGVRVHLLGIRPQQGGNLSQFLLNEADQVHHWDADTVRGFLACVPQANAPANYRVDPQRSLEWAAQRTVDAIGVLPSLLDRINALHRANRPHPRDVDALLLRLASDAIGGARLTDQQQRQVRQWFRQRVARAATPATPNTTP
ncbi:MAG: NYN domain-containing protein [Acidobacteria bacterium]|nr:NYN domain-containing protein [Acidobacteriota bacterium]